MGSACFYVTISGSFERFQYLNFETDFLKTGISEANVKTNRMVSKKWSYHKERSFASECFIFLKILFQFKNLFERADLMYQRHKCPYSYFLSAGVLFGGAFSLWVSLKFFKVPLKFLIQVNAAYHSKAEALFDDIKKEILKKKLWYRCFPVNFSKFLRTPFLQNISGRLLLGWGRGQKASPPLKSVTHILQWWNLVHLYLT